MDIYVDYICRLNNEYMLYMIDIKNEPKQQLQIPLPPYIPFSLT